MAASILRGPGVVAGSHPAGRADREDRRRGARDRTHGRITVNLERFKPQFESLEVGGIRLRAAFAGSGPLIVLVHGFPESWYSWRHQIGPLAAQGYRVCAIDMRGYGGSDRPQAVIAYDMQSLVADIAGVIHALSPDRAAILIGHDWGAPIVWTTALVHPKQVRAVAGLSVPYMGVPPKPLNVMLDESYTQRRRFHYQVYFEAEGPAEAEFEADVRSALLRIYYSASGDAPLGAWSRKAFGARLLDGVESPDRLPLWLTDADLDYLAGEFARSGFRGPLNRYRNYERDFAFLHPHRHRKIEQPSFYIGGTRDLVLSMIPNEDPDAALREHATDVRGVHLIDGCGHWTQQERPEQVTALLLAWLASIER
jgi:pimeloyl-ACP methyl ester carboxylesterase